MEYIVQKNSSNDEYFSDLVARFDQACRALEVCAYVKRNSGLIPDEDLETVAWKAIAVAEQADDDLVVAARKIRDILIASQR